MSVRLSARELWNRAESEALARVKNGQPAQISPGMAYNAAKDEATVFVLDAIGGWFGIDPKEWVPAFAAIKAKTIHLRVNSPGGSVFDAESMRTIVSQHPARVIAHIDGYAASAAATLVTAADEVEISSGAYIMVHDAWACGMGRAEELESCAALLRKTTAGIAAAYARRTGKPLAQVRKWMADETWFSAPEALEHGFVDKIYVPGPAASSTGTDKAKRERALQLAALQAKI
ncbi:head maturation protease, ClpP-related [Desulfomicrobium escambiense]|uniref:head maturation protease, ClpP-related n=1 Tax=Desulfomicrobium escambiense TaxID=29503 RepID=UPI0004059A81|nr:head maturation protease, ClpP-related [Desulfomicrobium escambiense]